MMLAEGAGVPLARGLTALMLLWPVVGFGFALTQTPIDRMLNRSAWPEDRPAVFAAQFALSHAAWLVTDPLAGRVEAAFRLPAAALLLVALGGVSLAGVIRLWPKDDPDVPAHDHPTCLPAIRISPKMAWDMRIPSSSTRSICDGLGGSPDRMAARGRTGSLLDTRTRLKRSRDLADSSFAVPFERTLQPSDLAGFTVNQQRCGQSDERQCKLDPQGFRPIERQIDQTDIVVELSSAFDPVIINAQGHHREIGATEPRFKPVERRHFFTARRAPGCPDVQKDHPTGEVVEFSSGSFLIQYRG